MLKNTPFAGSLEAVNRRQTVKQKEKQEIFRRQIIFPNVSNRKHLPNTVHHKQLQRNQNEANGRSTFQLEQVNCPPQTSGG